MDYIIFILEQNSSFVMTKVSLILIHQSLSTDDIKAYFLSLSTSIEIPQINIKWTTYKSMGKKHDRLSEWQPAVYQWVAGLLEN